MLNALSTIFQTRVFLMHLNTHHSNISAQSRQPTEIRSTRLNEKYLGNVVCWLHYQHTSYISEKYMQVYHPGRFAYFPMTQEQSLSDAGQLLVTRILVIYIYIYYHFRKVYHIYIYTHTFKQRHDLCPFPWPLLPLCNSQPPMWRTSFSKEYAFVHLLLCSQLQRTLLNPKP